MDHVPLLHRYNGEFRLPVTRPTALRFLRLVVPQLRHVFVPAGTGTTPVGLGLFFRLPSGFRLRRSQDLPGSWENLMHMPRSQTPVSPSCLAGHGMSVLPSELSTSSALTASLLSGLNHAAYALPVYASQRGLPQRHATLGSDRWLIFVGRDSHPQVLSLRFPSCFWFHEFLLSQA